MKLFCKHELSQDIRMVPISETASEAKLFGINCLKCGKHWDHWTRRLSKRYQNETFTAKLKKCLEVIKK